MVREKELFLYLHFLDDDCCRVARTGRTRTTSYTVPVPIRGGGNNGKTADDNSDGTTAVILLLLRCCCTQ